MLTNASAWDIGIVLVATLVTVICLIIMFPRAEVLALAGENALTFAALLLAIGVAALIGGIGGIRHPLPQRAFKGFGPAVWGPGFGLTVGLFGVASVDWSLPRGVFFSHGAVSRRMPQGSERRKPAWLTARCGPTPSDRPRAGFGLPW